MYNKTLDAKYFNDLSKGFFPELLGINITHVEEGKMTAKMAVKKEYFAPNGFLHAGSIVTFADTIAGYSSLAHLPMKGKSFTKLKNKKPICKVQTSSNFKLPLTKNIFHLLVSRVLDKLLVALLSHERGSTRVPTEQGVRKGATLRLLSLLICTLYL